MPSYHHHRVALVGAISVLFYHRTATSYPTILLCWVVAAGTLGRQSLGLEADARTLGSGHVSENTGCWALDDTWLSTERIVVATRQRSFENTKNIHCHGLRGRVNFEFEMRACRPYHLFVSSGLVTSGADLARASSHFCPGSNCVASSFGALPVGTSNADNACRKSSIFCRGTHISTNDTTVFEILKAIITLFVATGGETIGNSFGTSSQGRLRVWLVA